MILACKNITKSFGTDIILNDISFHINEREKAAIIGINGAGKSTLFKIIMGEIPYDGGEIVFAKGMSIGYLAQHQEISTDNSIYDEVLSVKADIIRMEENIRQLELDMKNVEGEKLEQMLNTYTRLVHEFESKNGYAYKSEVTGVLKGLGFNEEDFNKKAATLSGGQKTRVALSKLLLSKPDLILLDEPTNHLDMESIAWLETFLANYSGAVLVIAHDRYFLDKIVTKVIELENTKAISFEGNYTEYAKKKRQLRDTQIKQYLNQQSEIKHQEEVIAKLRSFNREKSIKRAESREKLLNKIDVLEKPAELHSEINIKLVPKVLSGNDVLTVKHLSKAFGSNRLFDDINFEIKRGEKVAIIGNNGTGKTTILKIINNVLESDFGEIKLGSKVHIGYYDQEQHILNMDKTIFDEISDEYPDMDNTQIRNTLAAFLFTGDDVFKFIKELSGGERGRVQLAKLMLSEANFLILDEPTNHLDIVSKEILENAINNYEGTVLYVSHDRYFINSTATRIMDLTRNVLVNYIGSYDYYLEKKPETEQRIFGVYNNIQNTQTAENAGALNNKNLLTGLKVNQKVSLNTFEDKSSETDSKLDWKKQKEEQAKLRKKKNDLKKIEDEIASLEERNAKIDNEITNPENFANSYKLNELTKEKDVIENKLLELMEKWEELAE